MLYRQSVGVPARLARTVESAHVLVAGKDVFERTRENVVNPGLAIGGRGAFVPGVEGAAFALALARLEDVVVSPQLDDALLERGSIVARADFLEPHAPYSRISMPCGISALVADLVSQVW